MGGRLHFSGILLRGTWHLGRDSCGLSSDVFLGYLGALFSGTCGFSRQAGISRGYLDLAGTAPGVGAVCPLGAVWPGSGLAKGAVLALSFQAGCLWCFPPLSFLPFALLSWNRKVVWKVGEEAPSLGMKRRCPIRILQGCRRGFVGVQTAAAKVSHVRGCLACAETFKTSSEITLSL